MCNKNSPSNIRAGTLTLAPAWAEGADRSAELAAAIREAGDFELYFGVPETEERLSALSIARPMFYNIIDGNGSFVGYLGFHPEDDAYETEIYILSAYRRRGYAKKALSAAVRAAFNGDIEGIKDIRRIVSSVRTENTASHALMKSAGFAEDRHIPFFMSLCVSETDEECQPILIVFYYITKEMLN